MGTTTPTESTEPSETTDPTEPSVKEQCLALTESDWLVCDNNSLGIYNMSLTACGPVINMSYFACIQPVYAILELDQAQCNEIKIDEIEQCNNMP